MTHHTRPDRRDWLVSLLAATALGLVLPGVGGRIGMRVIAVASGLATAFSLEGSATVVFLGAGAGAVMGVLFLLARTLFPARRWARTLAFWILCLALVWRGLNPVSPLNLSAFLPLFLAHGALLQLFWCRVHMRRRASEPTQHPRADRAPVEQGRGLANRWFEGLEPLAADRPPFTRA
jgi:hypothetical protein